MATKMKQIRLAFSGDPFPHVTHYMFRYPAKFHPPVVRKLIDTYSDPSDTVLDPFGGSGTTAVEAALGGRHSISTDIDPLAVFVGRAKTTRIRILELQTTIAKFRSGLSEFRRSSAEYERRKFSDIKNSTLRNNVKAESLWLPAIPNLQHWFRRYVLVDLGRILKLIHGMELPESHRRFLLLGFASIIRNASNADPVPVSGLEVTAHMRHKDERGRIVDPFRLLDVALIKNFKALCEYCEATNAATSAIFRRVDATRLTSHVTSRVDAVITSPPYHNAVDYYRRHTLEMYWLRMTDSPADRLRLLPQYIGRATVPMTHTLLAEPTPEVELIKRWEKRIRAEAPARANAFKHYVVAMHKTFHELHRLLPKGRPAIFVVGKSTWNGYSIPTADLLASLSSKWFVEQERLWYPVKNRYMSYARRNGANIDREYVIVLKRR